jgi:hypothetical protein
MSAGRARHLIIETDEVGEVVVDTAVSWPDLPRPGSRLDAVDAHGQALLWPGPLP